MPVDTHEDIMPAAGIEGPNVVETHEDIKPAMGMTAYHGSPHEFEQFDTSKIGTGEGAQAYGHGLYFAGNENVARSYKGAGQPAYLGNDRAEAAQKLLEATNGDRRAAMELANQSMLGSKKYGEGKLWQDVVNNFDELVGRGAGHMYEVNLDVGPENLLDWDKPLNEQHPKIQEAISKHKLANRLLGNDVVKGELVEPTGQSILNRLIGKPFEKSQQLSDLGIRGIRYLDAGSRGQDGKSGTHNYVIFDPQHIKIKRRYAEGGEVPEGEDEGITAYAFGNSVPHLDARIEAGEAPEMMGEAPSKAYGGAIAGPKLTEENAEDFARRLILWSYAAAPFVNRSIRRATGGEVDPSVDQALDAARGASQADPAASATETARSLTPMGFYSAAAEAAGKIPQRAPIDQILNKVKGSPGVKAEELDWSGVKDAFAGQRSVDPQEVARHFQANLPALQETVKYDPSDIARKLSDQRAALMWHGRRGSEEDEALRDKITQTYNPSWRRENAAVYGEYTIPDGANYREVLLHLPENEAPYYEDFESWFKDNFKPSNPTAEQYSRRYAEQQWKAANGKIPNYKGDNNYQSSHWNVPNVVAHLRLSDRDMGKTLHMEELQSDWGQEKRDGEKLPDAPHISSNEGWTDLGLKRALLEAAKGGYKELIWTPGQEQADRYDLSQQVKHIMWSPDNKILSALTHDNSEAIGQRVEKEDLHKYIGKEAAKKLLDQEPEMDGNMATHHLRGQAISVGGEGMKNYYDRFFPGRIQKLISKLDPEAKIQLHGYRMFVPDEREGDSEEGEYKNFHSLKITPKLRAAILKGLPAYERGGSIVNKALDVVSGLRR